MNHLFMPFGFRMPLMPKRWIRQCPKYLLAGCALLLAFALSVHAKSSEDYFRLAASQYVAGKLQEASVEAEEGLRAYPDDARLQMLAEHLRKMKDEQSGRSGQNKQKGDGNQEPPQGDERNQDQQKNESDSDKGDQKSDRPSPNDRPEDRDEDGHGEGERPRPQAMTEEEAKRLLNSFADDEKKEQAERRKVMRSRAGTEQDW